MAGGAVGDGLFLPGALHAQRGQPEERRAQPGVGWLMNLQQHFRDSIWMNPEPRNYWEGTTIDAVRQVFEMFPMTLEGLTQGMAHLTKGRQSRRSAA